VRGKVVVILRFLLLTAEMIDNTKTTTPTHKLLMNRPVLPT
jgi:hypothetical protein